MRHDLSEDTRGLTLDEQAEELEVDLAAIEAKILEFQTIAPETWGMIRKFIVTAVELARVERCRFEASLPPFTMSEQEKAELDAALHAEFDKNA